MKPQQGALRTFLFLQGPHGSFFPKLGAELRRIGHRVGRVNFNGGDRATWPDGIDFHGLMRHWPRFLDRLIARHAITDIVLFGDCRPNHVEAIRVARSRNVRVHVFEEGYVRPDWVTLERDGVNGHSTMPRDAAWYLDQARGLPAVSDHASLPSYATARGWAAFFYYAEVVLQHWRFPFGGGHRNRNPVWEGIRFLRRFRQREAEADRTRAALARLVGRRYMIFPLQLNSDYQIRVHSRFGSMHAAIRHVLGSFARSAPADLSLVVKEHPLDSGLVNWRAEVSRVAGELGIVDRVIFLEQGDLSELVDGADGMVTVNSTSGTLALAAAKPVKVLGSAVYDIEGITDPQPLDGFWTAPNAPDPRVYDAFYRVLVDRCLIPGAFLSNAGIDMLVSAATARLTTADAGFLVTATPHHG